MNRRGSRQDRGTHVKEEERVGAAGEGWCGGGASAKQDK